MISRNYACIGRQAPNSSATSPGGLRDDYGEKPQPPLEPGGTRDGSDTSCPSRNPCGLGRDSDSESSSSSYLSGEFELPYRPKQLARQHPYARLIPANVSVYTEPLHYVASVQALRLIFPSTS